MSQEPSPSIRVRPPPTPVSATLSSPGSKSLTNRALILAALASGRSTLRGCLDSEDTSGAAASTAVRKRAAVPAVATSIGSAGASSRSGGPPAPPPASSPRCSPPRRW